MSEQALQAAVQEDARAREAALDPARSFIVQAPAGSGKTGLLTQRFLVLLARVETPEEVVAITFTRKAAGEMRGRILEALAAAGGEAPADDHERRTWTLAREVLARDTALGWQLVATPDRLRILTIDALNAALIRQMPVLSRFGAPPSIAEDASELYREAARETLRELDSEAHWRGAVERLLLHLDNHWGRVETLLAEMRKDDETEHLEVVENSPATIAGRAGVLLHIRFRNDKGLEIQRRVYAFVDSGGIYTLSYQAPTLHYFDRDFEVFEHTVRSFRTGA